MKQLKNARGVVFIYVTLFLLVLGILFFGLGLDVGWMTYVRSQGQTAVDAAALAGAGAIPNYNKAGDPTVVGSLITASNNSVINGPAGISLSDTQFCDGSASSPNCSSTLGAGVANNDVGGVKVTKTFQPRLYFGRMFTGGSDANVTTSSIAWLGGPGTCGTNCLPVTMCGQDLSIDFSKTTPQCDPTKTATFNPNGTDTAGYWNLITTSMSASQCKSLVQDPSPLAGTEVTQDINLNNGTIDSCLSTIGNKFAGCDATACAGGPNAAGKTQADCTATIPIIDCPGSINQSQPVKGFASICITQVVSTGNPKGISVASVCNVQASGSIGGGPQFGTYANRPVLVK